MTGTTVVGSFSPSVLLRVARRRGYLQEAGLEVTEVPVTSSPAQFRSLVDGELDLALTSPDNVLAYRFSDHNPLGTRLDARIVSCVDRGLGLALYGRPGLTDPAELRGADIAVDVPTSGFALALYALADHLGLARDEYATPSHGSTPSRLQALLRGDCAATMLNAGNELLAEEQGCVALARAAHVCPPYVGTVLAVLGDEHLEEAERLAGCLARTAAAILAGGAGEDAAAEAEAGLGLPAALARHYVDRLRDRDEGLVPGGRPDADGLRTIVDLRRRYLPETVDGHDVLSTALDPDRGLVVGGLTGRDA